MRASTIMTLTSRATGTETLRSTDLLSGSQHTLETGLAILHTTLTPIAYGTIAQDLQQHGHTIVLPITHTHITASATHTLTLARVTVGEIMETSTMKEV